MRAHTFFKILFLRSLGLFVRISVLRSVGGSLRRSVHRSVRRSVRPLGHRSGWWSGSCLICQSARWSVRWLVGPSSEERISNNTVPWFTIMLILIFPIILVYQHDTHTVCPKKNVPS